VLSARFTHKIVIRGGGDLATGAAQKFHRAGFPVVILETFAPTAIRRSAALCEAVYDGYMQVEDIVCRRVAKPEDMDACWRSGAVPLLVDPSGDFISGIQPAAVIDAILAKRNLGTNIGMADIVIALGPGFCAGVDAHAVIETMRGHDLGRLILDGCAKPDTGIPGDICDKSTQRVLRAPVSGIVAHKKQIGDIVEHGQLLFTVGGEAVAAPFRGLLRGLIREGMDVPRGMKVADIDPRTDVDWRTVSDKARCLGGAVLEAFLYLHN
jgi:xanthine dehydrogenase accessory factor